MAIDLKAGGRNKKTHRTAPKSRNPYLLLLVKVSRAPPVLALNSRLRSLHDRPFIWELPCCDGMGFAPLEHGENRPLQRDRDVPVGVSI
ncbi:unnamed protein product [Closterium sp. NIES-53]